MANTNPPKSAPQHPVSPESPFMKLQSEVSQAYELRSGLIKKIQDHFKAQVFVYFTSFADFTAEICNDDAEMLENVLSVEHDGNKLILILNSPGGQALAAERIVNVCRAYSDNNFDVVVPHMAKSAATMICFGASTIHMSKTAELGPVDPQVIYKNDAGDERWLSAAEYVRSYDKLMTAATSGRAKRLEPLLQQLSRYDARYIEQLLSHQQLSEDISVRLLKSGMMKGRSEKSIKRAIAPFLVQQQKSEHGRMINQEEAACCGLSLKTLDLKSDIWNRVWELYVRSNFVVQTQCKAIIESPLSAARR